MTTMRILSPQIFRAMAPPLDRAEYIKDAEDKFVCSQPGTICRWKVDEEVSRVGGWDEASRRAASALFGDPLSNIYVSKDKKECWGKSKDLDWIEIT